MNRLSPLAFAGALVATSLTVMSASPVQASTMRIHYTDLSTADAGCRGDGIATPHAALDRANRGEQVQLASR
jgi:hypothetical protein